MAYHAVTGGFILGEIIQRVTGNNVRQYLDKTLRVPMGMEHFTFGVSEEKRDRVARNYVCGAPVRFPISKLLEKALIVPIDAVVDGSNQPEFMESVIPAGNIYCSADELSKFYQMLMQHGEWNGKQILKPETVNRLAKPACKLAFDHTMKIPMRYSEGLMMGASPFGLWGPMSSKAYGHIGFMNIMGWADPTRDLSVGLMVSGKAVLGNHLFALGELLATIGWQCRK